MKSNYSFDKKESYLSLTISGGYDKSDFLSYIKLIKEECEKEKTFKILVHIIYDEETNVPIMDRFLLGEEIANVLGNKIKLAITVPEKNMVNKYAETVAVNRGANICVLSGIENAEAWLLNNGKYK